MKRSLVFLCGLWTATASAQPILFDDFDGPDLLPRWRTPNPSHWEYSLSDSQLHVTGLFYPGIPHLGGNFAAIGALYEPQTDVRVDARMGWDPGIAPHALALEVVGPGGGSIIAEIRYSNEEPGRDPILIAQASGGALVMPAPPPGMYDWAIARIGSQWEFYVDGGLFARVPDVFRTPAAGVVFDFLGPSEGPLGPFHIDRVRVVPGPGVPMVMAIAAAACLRRARACSQSGGVA